MPVPPRHKTIALVTIGMLGLALWVVGNFLTSDTEGNIVASGSSSGAASRDSDTGSSPVQTAAPRVIYRGDPPYLSELAILDGNLFLSHVDDHLLLGGANVDLVRFSAGTRSGGRATVQFQDNAIAFLMDEEPYVEFAYQDGFYSIQILSRAYFYTLEISELPAPSVRLTQRYE